MKTSACLRMVAATVLALGALCPPASLAQVPARFYWKSLSGAKCGAAHRQLHQRQHEPVRHGSHRDARRELRRHAGDDGLRAHLHPVRIARRWPRSSCRWAGSRARSSWPARRSASRPAGSATRCSSSTSTSSARRRRRTSRRRPALRAGVLARPARRPGAARSASTTTSQPLNIGQNRWYGRARVRRSSGSSAPGCRAGAPRSSSCPRSGCSATTPTTSGRRLETEPMFQLDAHLTRDFTEHFWGSLDALLVQRRPGDHQRRSGEQAQQRRRRPHARLCRSTTTSNLTFGYKSTDRRQRARRTCAWTASWSRSCSGGTRSSRGRNG